VSEAHSGKILTEEIDKVEHPVAVHDVNQRIWSMAVDLDANPEGENHHHCQALRIKDNII
jgi:hypothetical protein